MSKQYRNKLSTYIPISNQNETNSLEFVSEFVLLKEMISVWSRRAESGPNRNNLFSIRQIWYQYVLVSFPEWYRNVCPFVFYITSCNTCHYCTTFLQNWIHQNSKLRASPESKSRIFKNPGIKIGYYTYLLISGHLTMGGRWLWTSVRLVGEETLMPVEILCLEHDVRITETRLLDGFCCFQIKRLQYEEHPVDLLQILAGLYRPCPNCSLRCWGIISGVNRLDVGQRVLVKVIRLQLLLTQDSCGSVFSDAGINEKLVFENWCVTLTITTTSHRNTSAFFKVDIVQV